MSYQFPPDLERMIHDRMVGGRYQSEDELLVDAMHALADVEQRQEQLRAEIQGRIAHAGGPLSRPLDRAEFKSEARRSLGKKE